MSAPTTGFGSVSLYQVADGFGPADVASSLSVLSFWSAIALPMVYLPLLATGVHTVDGLFLFLGLLGLHVLALIGGQGHARADRAGQHARVR